MSKYLTPELNEQNIEYVRSQIQKKNSNTPYMANNNSVTNVVTDFDHHPYSRWFRGVYYYPDPIVIEREAGWRPQHDSCYKVVSPYVREPEPNHCFEPPCSTIFPCYSFGKKERKMNIINNTCMVQYR